MSELDILRIIVLVTGFGDAWKYRWLAQKVAKNQSSKDISRKFLNISIVARLFLLLYGIVGLHDWVVVSCCAIALLTLFNAYYLVYIYYPYKYRNLLNFKRPSIFVYIFNSLLPNRWTQKL